MVKPGAKRLWFPVAAFLLANLVGAHPASGQQVDPCAGRSPRFLALTVVGIISPVWASDGTVTRTPRETGEVQFIDMCRRDEFGLAQPIEALPSSSCVRQFGSEARTEILAMQSSEGRPPGFHSTCVAETVEAICEALSDCGVPPKR